MRKRVLAACLAVLLVCGLMPAAGAAVSSGDAQAYLNVLDNNPGASSYLVDFDGDGSDELLLTWRKSERNFYEVWSGGKKLISEEARVSFDGVWGAPDYSADLYLFEKDGVTYLCKHYIVLANEVWNLYTLRNGAWVLQEDLICVWQVNDGANDPDDGYWICTRNGKPISHDEYDKMSGELWKNEEGIVEGVNDTLYHSVRSELLAALDTPSDSYQDVLNTLSASEKKALFDDFLYCVAGVDTTGIRGDRPFQGFDCRTESDDRIVNLLEALRVDTNFPISDDPFPQAEFTNMTRRYFGRTIDYSNYAIDHQPTMNITTIQSIMTGYFTFVIPSVAVM